MDDPDGNADSLAAAAADPFRICEVGEFGRA
jgi:hypothetical protein